MAASAQNALACGSHAERLRTRLQDRLDALGGPRVAVTALGTSDVFSDPPQSVDAGALPISLYGHHAVVGPTAPPACAHCLARRWQALRSASLRDALELGTETRPAGEWPYCTTFVEHALAALVMASAERLPAGRFSEVRLLDLRSLTVRRYPLVPDPECPNCAAPGEDCAETARIALEPALKYRPGSFRTRPLDSYDIETAAFANPLCGALGPSLVQDVSSTSTSATIGCFSTRSGSYLVDTFWGGHTGSFDDSARVGLLEGLERYAGMRARGRRTVVTEALNALGPIAVDPRLVGLYADSFYRDNSHVRPFSPDREVAWVWGWSLRDDAPRLVPEILAYYHVPHLKNRFVQESSNGCASGGSLEEAVYFGLMELVERDAFLLTWYGRQPLPEIDPASSTRSSTRAMVDRLAMYGYRARFFDTRITFPIPVVTAVAERFDGGLGRMCFGAGASIDPESAIDSALCEIATDAVNLPGRSQRDESRLRAMAADFDLVTALHDHPLVYGIPEMGVHADFLLRQDTELGAKRPVSTMRWPEIPELSAQQDIRNDLERCITAVTAEGFDVVVVDQTLPEQRRLGLHTVKVLVPGLLPIDFGWSRQRALHMPRLRTASREAGLRAEDLGSEDINVAPHPFP